MSRLIKLEKASSGATYIDPVLVAGILPPAADRHAKVRVALVSGDKVEVDMTADEVAALVNAARLDHG